MNDYGRVRFSLSLGCALIAAGVLAGCAATAVLPANPFATPAAAPAPEPPQAAVAPPPGPSGRRPAAAAGRQQAAPPPPEPSSSPPMTDNERLMAARGHCWMK